MHSSAIVLFTPQKMNLTRKNSSFLSDITVFSGKHRELHCYYEWFFQFPPVYHNYFPHGVDDLSIVQGYTPAGFVKKESTEVHLII